MKDVIAHVWKTQYERHKEVQLCCLLHLLCYAAMRTFTAICKVKKRFVCSNCLFVASTQNFLSHSIKLQKRKQINFLPFKTHFFLALN